MTTKPDNVGLDWIPFVMLAMPWSGMQPGFAIPGVLLNGVLLYVLGTVLQVCVRNLRGH